MTLLLLVLTGSAPCWPDTVPALDLAFEWESWEYACEHSEQDIWIDATLTSGGIDFPCSFRIRGATSRVYPKKSIKIVLDGGAELFGQSELNLNAEYLDRTRIRECLAYRFYSRIGQTVPETHFTELSFNGEPQGAYLSVQDVDGAFLESTFLPDGAVIYKCADRYSSLDSATDLAPYEKKTAEDEPWDDLVLLIRWLTLVPDSLFDEGIRARFRTEDLETCIAANVLLGHGSTYYHNYHLVLERSGTVGPWRFIPWDMDRTWGLYGPDLPYTRNSSTEGLRRNPLIWRMWCSDVFREELVSAIRALEPDLEGLASSGIVDSLAAITRPLVEIDPFRDFSMEEFEADLDVVRSWPGARSAALEGMFSSWPAPIRLEPPVMTDEGLLVRWRDAGPGVAYTLRISTDITFQDEEALLFQSSTPDTCMTVPVGCCPDGAWMDVFVSAAAGSFRSENGPIEPQEISGPSLGHDMVIDEINYLSGPGLDAGDWLELVNAGADTVNLAGWAVRDASDGHLTTLPEALVPPGGFVVLPADEILFGTVHPDVPLGCGSLNHGLADGGDLVRLWDLSGGLSDYVAYLPSPPWPPEPAGRGPSLSLIDPSLPNSMPSSWIAGPVGGTPGLPNDSDPGGCGSSVIHLLGPGPNPADEAFVLRFESPASGTAVIGIYDMAGRLAAPLRTEFVDIGAVCLDFDASGLAQGRYHVAVIRSGMPVVFPLTILRNLP